MIERLMRRLGYVLQDELDEAVVDQRLIDEAQLADLKAEKYKQRGIIEALTQRLIVVEGERDAARALADEFARDVRWGE